MKQIFTCLEAIQDGEVTIMFYGFPQRQKEGELNDTGEGSTWKKGFSPVKITRSTFPGSKWTSLVLKHKTCKGEIGDPHQWTEDLSGDHLYSWDGTSEHFNSIRMLFCFTMMANEGMQLFREANGGANPWPKVELTNLFYLKRLHMIQCDFRWCYTSVFKEGCRQNNGGSLILWSQFRSFRVEFRTSLWLDPLHLINIYHYRTLFAGPCFFFFSFLWVTNNDNQAGPFL